MKTYYQKPQLLCSEVFAEQGFTLSAGADEDSMKYDNGGNAW